MDLRGREMELSYLFRILITPSCWIRAYKTDETADRFVRTLIDNQNEVRVLGRDIGFIYLEAKGRIFALWIANKWGAYLSSLCTVPDINRPYIHGFEVERIMPSRETCFRFHDTFEKFC